MLQHWCGRYQSNRRAGAVKANCAAAPVGMSKPAVNPFRYFNSSPEVIRLVVMMYVRSPLSLRNVEDLLFERGIDISHETVRYWWNRFGPLFASDIRRHRVSRMRGDMTPISHPAATRDRPVLSRMSAGEATGGVNPARC